MLRAALKRLSLGKHLITLYAGGLTLPSGWLSRSNLPIEGWDVKVE